MQPDLPRGQASARAESLCFCCVRSRPERRGPELQPPWLRTPAAGGQQGHRGGRPSCAGPPVGFAGLGRICWVIDSGVSPYRARRPRLLHVGGWVPEAARARCASALRTSARTLSAEGRRGRSRGAAKPRVSPCPARCVDSGPAFRLWGTCGSGGAPQPNPGGGRGT